MPEAPGRRPVAVLLHGGCWRDIAGPGYMEELAAELGSLGWATWNLAYRLLDRPGGGWPHTFLDVAAGADHVRELALGRPLDPTRVVAVGHSSGGHLALWLAARHRISRSSVLRTDDPLPLAGVVSLAGIADLEAFHALERRACGDGVARLLGGHPADVPERTAAASPARLLPLDVPQLLVTGDDDPDVPADFVEGYAQRAREVGEPDVTHARVPDAGHFEIVAPWCGRWPAVRARIVPFLRRVEGG